MSRKTLRHAHVFPHRHDPRLDRREGPAGPGRPRSARARAAILEAAGALLRERGLREMSIEGIAARAGVSKKTIYRWWPSKGVLALDAFYRDWLAAQGELPDTGGLEGDLQALMQGAVAVLAEPHLAATVAALVAEAQSDRELGAAYEEHVLGPQRARLRTVFERAAANGELRPDGDVEVAVDLLQGALNLRLLHTHAPLDTAFADAAVSLVARGLLAGVRSAEH